MCGRKLIAVLQTGTEVQNNQLSQDPQRLQEIEIKTYHYTWSLWAVFSLIKPLMYKLGTNEVLGFQCSIINDFGVQDKPVKVSKSPISIEILGCRIYIHFLLFVLGCLQVGDFFWLHFWELATIFRYMGLVFIFVIALKWSDNT